MTARLRRKAAADHRRDLVLVMVAKGVEIARGRRGSLVSAYEYEDIELSAMLAVYLVALDLAGGTADEARQARILERARAVASERLGVDLEAERA